MFLKVIGQIVMTGVFASAFPMNAAVYEHQLDETLLDPGVVSAAELASFDVQLPLADEREIPRPMKVDLDSHGIVTTAKSALVQDVRSGAVLFSKNAYDVRSIGSVTKLMTAIVLLRQEVDLDAYVTVVGDDFVYGGRTYVAFDDALRLEDVFAASVVGSDNTATRALARLSGLEYEAFIAEMNVVARELGMDSSVFVDPTGIDAGNVSTVFDLTLLLEEADEYEALREYMRARNVTIVHSSGISSYIESTNQVLESFLHEGEYEIVAGKTGYLPQAGYVLATTVDRDGDDVHVIVLGADSKDDRMHEVIGLAAWAYKVFEWPN